MIAGGGVKGLPQASYAGGVCQIRASSLMPVLSSSGMLRPCAWRRDRSTGAPLHGAGMHGTSWLFSRSTVPALRFQSVPSQGHQTLPPEDPRNPKGQDQQPSGHGISVTRDDFEKTVPALAVMPSSSSAAAAEELIPPESKGRRGWLPGGSDASREGARRRKRVQRQTRSESDPSSEPDLGDTGATVWTRERDGGHPTPTSSTSMSDRIHPSPSLSLGGDVGRGTERDGPPPSRTGGGGAGGGDARLHGWQREAAQRRLTGSLCSAKHFQQVHEVSGCATSVDTSR